MPKLTEKALTQLEHIVVQTLDRMDRRLDKLSTDLESVQQEVNDLRNIRSTFHALWEMVKENSK